MASRLAALWYDFLRIPVWMTLSYGFSLRMKGGHHVPKSGPALLVANHQSFLDPALVGCATWRHLRYLGRQTLFGSKLFGKLIESLGCIPIDQEGFAREGLTKTIDLLNSGEAVLIFPEGARTEDGKMQPLKGGIRLLIRYSDAPVIPVGIAGAFEAYPRDRAFPRPAPIFSPSSRGKIGVVIGEPISSESLRAMKRDEVTDHLYQAIHKQQQEAEALRQVAGNGRSNGRSGHHELEHA